MALELKQFLLTGRLGPLRCGMTEQDVVREFGEPSQKRVFDKAHGCFREVRLFYDALTIFFERDVISLYGLWMEDSDRIPAFMEPVGYFPFGGNVPMDEFLIYLKTEAIPFRDRTDDEDDSCRVFTQGGVAVRGYGVVLSLVVPCPGTERWKTIKERWRYYLHPPRPFQKP